MVFEAKYPIVGFDDIKKYELKLLDDNFATITNVEGSAPSFMLVNPFVLREYEFDIPFVMKALMGIQSDTNMLIYLILIVKKPFEDSLANFLAPLVFNVDNKTMAQVVLDEQIYKEFTNLEPLSKFTAKKA